MKPKIYFVIAGKFCFILLFVLCFNCVKDDSSGYSATPPPPPPPPPPVQPSCVNCQLLYYGGNQLDAPTIDVGRYQAAARFTPLKIGNLVGKTIKEIHYFFMDKPDSIIIKLYGPMDDKGPGALLYSADVTSAAEHAKWNVHTLTQAITLKNEDIWLSIEFKLTSSRKTIGCDPGPALVDGDWLYSFQDNQWIAFN